MISLVKIIDTTIDNLKRRVVKFLRLGGKDVQSSLQAEPYGVDAHPIKDMIAIYAKTGEKGKTVIIGYINKNQQALIGEHRLFSTDKNGVEKAFLWLRNDGNLEVNGDDDNMVRFSELKTEFDKLTSDFNSLVSTFNTHVHPGVTAGGASTLVTVTSGAPSTADIADAKIDEVKTLKKQP